MRSKTQGETNDKAADGPLGVNLFCAGASSVCACVHVDPPMLNAIDQLGARGKSGK
jgi:hypothetical protein